MSSVCEITMPEISTIGNETNIETIDEIIEENINNKTSNISSGAQALIGEFEFNNRLLLNVVGYSILLVIGTIGNTIVGFLSYRQNVSPENKGRTNVHKMVLHLTLADLIVSYIVIPLEIGWRLSVQVCISLMNTLYII